MDEERKPWEQDIEHGEPDLWYGRFVKFMRLGTRRSINAVYAKEHKEKQGKASTKIGPEWYEAARKWEWEDRARAYDKYQRAEEDKIIAEERDKVMRSGFALDHNRIKILDRLSRQLIAFTREEDKIWIPETRTIGTGDNAQIVEKVTFNHQPYALIDKYLDSIAKEKGERVRKTEITGQNGGPIRVERDPNLQLLTDEELAQAQHLASQLSSRQEGTE